jgi:hypothetical protein
MCTDTHQRTMERDRMNDAQQKLDTSRRDFLKKAGKMAVYVPPAMLALCSPSFEAIAQSSGASDQTPPSGNGGLPQWLLDWLRWLRGR